MQRKERARHTLFVAFLVCVACSALVTGAAVGLKPVERANRVADRQRHILAVAGLLEPGRPVAVLARRIETRVVDLDSGEYVALERPEAYDQRRAARDPVRSRAVAPAWDIARIKRRADYAPVYLVRDAGGAIQTIVLPVHGYGLWSTMYGFLALGADAATVVGLTFYEHAETPGLGGEIDNPRWKALWPGKRVYDEDGRPAIRVVKRPAPRGDPAAAYQVDAISGATLTSIGVENMLRFWLGDDGFGPFVERLREEGEG